MIGLVTHTSKTAVSELFAGELAHGRSIVTRVVAEGRALNEARTLSGLAHEIAHLRTALEAVADNVRRHEEQLRRLERRTERQTG